MGKSKGLEHSAYKKAAQIASRVVAEEVEDVDEIEEFHKEREKMLFDSDPENSDSYNESEEEGVFDVEGVDSEQSDEEESEEESGQEEDQDEESMSDLDTTEGGWGTRKKQFYSTDYVDELDSDIEAAEEEEEEVIKLQKKKDETLEATDFGLEDDILGKRRNSTSTASAPSSTLQQVNEELNSIDLDGNSNYEKISKDLSLLSKEEKLNLVKKDSPELLNLFDDFKTQLSHITEYLEPVLRKQQKGEMETSEGISFLEMKFQLLLSYCCNISFYLLLKSKGISVKNHPVIKQLVYLRTIMDRCKPLDQKLKYQIDKLVKTCLTSAAEDSSTPTLLKANPLNLVSKIADPTTRKDSSQVDSLQEGGSMGVYVPPKLSAVPYEEPNRERVLSKKEAQERRRNLKSNILRELRQEFSDKPLEVKDNNYQDGEEDEEMEHRLRYEEDNFVRLAVKKSKNSSKRKKMNNDFDELTDFGDFRPVEKSSDPIEESLLNGGGLKKKTLLQHVSKLEQSEKKRSRLHHGGDEDIPYREKSSKMNSHHPEDSYQDHDDAQPKKTMGKRDIHDQDDNDDDEHEFYKQAKQQKLDKKTHREEIYRPQNPYLDNSTEEAGNGEGKRGLSYEMKKNKGLTPKRKKEARNPRVKNKLKYEKAMVRRKGQVRDVIKNQGEYFGEKTGIKANLSRSVRMK